MLALAFVAGLLFIFAALLTYEYVSDPGQTRPRQFGLMTWLASGNWPAKVGAILMIIGLGALIRYFLLNVDWSADIKLGSGVLSAAVLAGASFYVRDRADHRGLHRALAGAALGVMYLTAYSAYAFFTYINELEALVFLGLLALTGGVYSVRENAESIAVLSMVGAFAAPAFTLSNPGPASVYGYYIGASTCAFVLVYIRGWRALIHLSFLFTLAGALFFGWTRAYYQPEHFDVLQPMLLALVAIHLAMPLAEHQASPGRWTRHFDLAYFMALPVVAGTLNLLIAPRPNLEGAMSLVTLGVLWAGAAGVVAHLRLGGVQRHGIVSFLFFLIALVMYLEDAPWSLVGLVATGIALTLSPRLALPRNVEQLLSGAVLTLWSIHVLGFLSQPLNGNTLLRSAPLPILMGVGALGLAAFSAQKRQLVLGKPLGVLALGWVSFLVLQEIIHLQLENLPQLAHGAAVVLACGIALFVPRVLENLLWPRALVILLVGTAWWAAPTASLAMTGVLMLPSAFALALLALRMEKQGAAAAPLIAATIPITLLPWAIRLDLVGLGKTLFIALILFVISVLVLFILGSSRKWKGAVWQRIQSMYFWGLLVGLAGTVAFHIERGLWPILFEIVTLATVALIAYLTPNDSGRHLAGIMTIAVAVLMLQAMLLRAFGPEGVLTAADVTRMGMPAMVSLMWAAYGGAICWWSARTSSRGIWTIGAVLLGIAAIKLVLLDFNSLGQLGNIVAMILAGAVFLGVAWIAPIPPKPKQATPTQSEGSHSTGSKAAVPERFGSPEGWILETAMSEKDSIAVEQNDTPTKNSGDLGFQQGGHTSEAPEAWPLPEYGHGMPKPAKAVPWALLLILGIALVTVVLWPDDTPRGAFPGAVPSPGPSNTPVIPQPIHQAPVQPLPEPAIAPVAGIRTPNVVDACSLFRDALPSDYTLLAGGEYRGQALNFIIDQSGHSATKMDVTVHEPLRPVVLVLGAYEPTIWNIRRTPGTRIAAVWVSGYHEQKVAGLSAQVPVLNSSGENHVSCGHFYVDRNNVSKTDSHLVKMFSKSADTYYIAENGRLQMGKLHSPENTIQDEPTNLLRYRVPDTPLSGQAGIEQLISEGKLRPATAEDLRSWDAANRQTTGNRTVVGGQIQLGNTLGQARSYVILGPLSYPAGLYGAHAVNFIIPRGIPRPTGNPGHSRIYDFENPPCGWPQC